MKSLHTGTVCLSVLLSCLTVTAQDGGQVHQETQGAPIYGGTYDVESGALLPPSGEADACELVFDNNATNGYFFAAGPGTINMDWGMMREDTSICEFQMGYATTSATPVDITVRLHADGKGWGVPGTNITAVPLTGLPGSDGVNVSSWIVDVVLAQPVPIAGCVFGYSYEMFDTVTGPLLVGPPNPPGVEDAFDQYDLGLNLIGTFWFGGTPMASFYMVLDGEPGDRVWGTYGTTKGISLDGVGSGLSGDIQTITIDGPVGELASLVIGHQGSDIYNPDLDVMLYAYPWDIQVDGIALVPDGTPLSGPLPDGIPAGQEILFQAYTRVAGDWKHSQRLTLTIQ